MKVIEKSSLIKEYVMENISVKQVETRADFNTFLNLPEALYADDPNYVPPLRLDLKYQFNKRKNPFFRHGDATVFIASRGKNVVGSIAALHNQLYNDFHHEKTGFFSYFECVNDQDTANQLFAAAEEWLHRRGLKQMIGPLSFSTETVSPGLLIKGFQYPPFLLMAHALPYYKELVEGAGFTKVVDALAFRMPVEQAIDERLINLKERVKRTRNIQVRFIDKKNFWRDVKIIMEIYNRAWEDNWGFVPPTKEEIDEIVKSLKRIYIKELVQIAEIDGEPVGWAITLPNINELLIHMKGRLFPFGIFKLLFGMKKIKGLRLWGLGINPEFRKRGVDVMLYYHTLIEGQRLGYPNGELSWILETNTPVINAAHLVHGEEYKRYRIYTRNL